MPNAPDSIRLFSLCSSMKWNHLPLVGGLYDQHPRLLEEFEILFHEIALERKRDEDKRKRESKAKKR